MSLILFYSNQCMSCKMLIDNIKRYNATEYFKLANVEVYAAKKILPPQIHSVPALMFVENKSIIFGKQVFDYLLLPNKGFLFRLPIKNNSNKESTQVNTIGQKEPMSFSIGSSSSDAFSFIEEEGSIDNHKSYNWAGIDDHIAIPTTIESDDGGVNTETRSKKTLPDISAIQAARELDIQNHLNTPSIPPPLMNR